MLFSRAFAKELFVKSHAVIHHTDDQVRLFQRAAYGDVSAVVAGPEPVQNRVFHQRLHHELGHAQVQQLPGRLQSKLNMAHAVFLNGDVAFHMVEFIGKGKAVLPLVEAEAEEVRKRGHDLADIRVGRAIAHPADHVQRVVEKMGIDLRLQGGIYRFLFLGPRLAELLGQAAYAAGHVVKFPAQHAYFIVRGVSDPRLKLARAKAAASRREARHRHRDAAGQQPRDAQHHQRNEHRRRYDDREHPCQPRKNLPVRNGQRQPVGAGGNLPGDDQIAVVLVVHGPALQLLGQRLPAERLRQKGEVFLRVAYAGEHGALLVADHDLRPRVGRQQAFQLGAVKADDDVAQELHIRIVQDAAGGQHHGPVPLGSATLRGRDRPTDTARPRTQTFRWRPRCAQRAIRS